MKLYHQIKSQLRLQQRSGVLTDRLVQSPADFWLRPIAEALAARCGGGLGLWFLCHGLFFKSAFAAGVRD
jgi:hypothetical protein